MDCKEFNDLSSTIASYAHNKIFESSTAMYRKFSVLRGKHIILDAIISGGKTSSGILIVNYLNKIGIPAKFIEEQFNLDHLAMFYNGISNADAANVAFSFQMDMLRLCQLNYKEANMWLEKNYVVISERTIWGNAVFAALQYSSGALTDQQFQIYLSSLSQFGPYHYDYVIYLDVDPSIALERVRQRNRESEENISLEYLEKLQAAYYCQLYHQNEYGAPLIIISNDTERTGLSQGQSYAGNILERIVNYQDSTKLQMTQPNGNVNYRDLFRNLRAL